MSGTSTAWVAFSSLHQCPAWYTSIQRLPLSCSVSLQPVSSTVLLGIPPANLFCFPASAHYLSIKRSLSVCSLSLHPATSFDLLTVPPSSLPLLVCSLDHHQASFLNLITVPSSNLLIGLLIISPSNLFICPRSLYTSLPFIQGF